MSEPTSLGEGNDFKEMVESMKDDERNVQRQQLAKRSINEFLPKPKFNAFMAVMHQHTYELQDYTTKSFGLTPERITSLCDYLLGTGPRESVVLTTFKMISDPRNVMVWCIAQEALYYKIATDIDMSPLEVKFWIDTYVAPLTLWYDTNLAGLVRASQIARQPVEDFHYQRGKSIRLLKRAIDAKKAIKVLFRGAKELLRTQGEFDELLSQSEEAEHELYDYTIKLLAKSHDQAQHIMQELEGDAEEIVARVEQWKAERGSPVNEEQDEDDNDEDDSDEDDSDEDDSDEDDNDEEEGAVESGVPPENLKLGNISEEEEEEEEKEERSEEEEQSEDDNDEE